MPRVALLVLFALPVLAACSQDYSISSEPPEVDPEDITECGFTQVGDQGQAALFKRYDCNPVFTDSGEAWSSGVRSTGFHAELVLGHPFYQLWYSADRADGNDYSLGYAISADGTDWVPQPNNPLLPVGTPQWRRSSMDGITVVWDSDNLQYVMTYQGLNLNTGDNGIGFMTSGDGQTWTPLNNDQPIIDLTANEGQVSYCWPLTLTHTPGEGLRGYIAGGPQNQTCQIYDIAGPDANNLVPNNQPVLAAGPNNSYDAGGMASAAVAVLDGTYYMFYTGIREFRPLEGTNFVTAYNTTLNVATSADGRTWQKHPDNPIREIGVTTQPNQILNIAAQTVGPRIHLWVDDYYPGPGLDRQATGYFLYEPNPVDSTEEQ